MITDKLTYSIDTKPLLNDINKFRNDYELQRQLSADYKNESIHDSLIWAENQIKQRGLVFTLFDGDFAGLTKLYRFPIDNRQNIYDVGIGLFKKFRGMGLGKKSLRYRLKSLYSGDVVLTTILKTNRPSLSLFESCGFAVICPEKYKNYPVLSDDWLLVELEI